MPIWLKEILAKPTTSVPLAGKALGLSPTLAYKAAHAGQIPFLRFGDRMVVSTAWLRRALQIDEKADHDATAA